MRVTVIVTMRVTETVIVVVIVSEMENMAVLLPHCRLKVACMKINGCETTGLLQIIAMMIETFG
jgi:hypothetical protein